MRSQTWNVELSDSPGLVGSREVAVKVGRSAVVRRALFSVDVATGAGGGALVGAGSELAQAALRQAKLNNTKDKSVRFIQDIALPLSGSLVTRTRLLSTTQMAFTRVPSDTESNT